MGWRASLSPPYPGRGGGATGADKTFRQCIRSDAGAAWPAASAHRLRLQHMPVPRVACMAWPLGVVGGPHASSHTTHAVALTAAILLGPTVTPKITKDYQRLPKISKHQRLHRTGQGLAAATHTCLCAWAAHCSPLRAPPRATGEGRFTFPDGSAFEGRYERGKRVEGCHVSAAGDTTYTGRCVRAARFSCRPHVT